MQAAITYQHATTEADARIAAVEAELARMPAEVSAEGNSAGSASYGPADHAEEAAADNREASTSGDAPEAVLGGEVLA